MPRMGSGDGPGRPHRHATARPTGLDNKPLNFATLPTVKGSHQQQEDTLTMPKEVGIDLGTTHSVVAGVGGGGAPPPPPPPKGPPQPKP